MTFVRKQKTLKQINRKVILNILRNSGKLEISELLKKVNHIKYHIFLQDINKINIRLHEIKDCIEKF